MQRVQGDREWPQTIRDKVLADRLGGLDPPYLGPKAAISPASGAGLGLAYPCQRSSVPELLPKAAKSPAPTMPRYGALETGVAAAVSHIAVSANVD